MAFENLSNRDEQSDVGQVFRNYWGIEGAFGSCVLYHRLYKTNKQRYSCIVEVINDF